MRLPGYCERCHRIRNVQVSGAGMAMLAVRRVATGICVSCQQKEDDERKGRQNGRK